MPDAHIPPHPAGSGSDKPEGTAKSDLSGVLGAAEEQAREAYHGGGGAPGGGAAAGRKDPAVSGDVPSRDDVTPQR